MHIYQQISQKNEIREFITFSLIGLSGFVIEIGLFNFFIYLGLPVMGAAVLAMPFAASSNWFLNRRFTFKLASQKRPTVQWSQYLIVSGLGMGLNLAIFWFGYTVLKLNNNLAKIIATGLVWFWNFGANKFWTFRAKS